MAYGGGGWLVPSGPSSRNGVEVDQAALLVLGDLGEGDPQDRVGGLLGHAEPGGDLAAQVGGEAGPQSGGVGVEQDRGRVVVRRGVQRRPEQGVRGFVELAAAAGPDVAAGGGGAVVDGAEGRRGEGGEDAGVGADGVGDGLAAGQAGADEVVGVGGVDAGAGRAARGAAVTARGEQTSRGLGGGGVGAEYLAGRGVDGGGAAGQADRFGAAAEVFDLLLCTVEVGVVDEVEQVPYGGACHVAQVQGDHSGRVPSVRVGGPEQQPAGSVGVLVLLGAWRTSPRGGRGFQRGGCGRWGPGLRVERVRW